ncbi:Fic family protein [Sphingobium sp.]|uniref:Fic family protein n=1 Tax=Sphingobium sp. TaxID=1912891 RepID=UPI0028BE070E|nr:Fic family protein [Sphingobium sp.]
MLRAFLLRFFDINLNMKSSVEPLFRLINRNDLSHVVRERLERYPAPYDNHYGVVPMAPPETGISLGSTAHRLTAAIGAIAQVDHLVQSIEDPYYIGRILVRQEAVSSSSIEGTNSTLDELLGIEEQIEEDRAEALQVRDYAALLERIVPVARAHGSEIFDLDLIREIHREVMMHDPDYRDIPGELRTCVVWIGGIRNIARSTYNPAPPAHVAPTLAHCLAYLRDEGMQAMAQSVVERMAIAHAHFEAVHPFRDCNGRVGRLLMPLVMAANGHAPLYLSPYIEAHKAGYVEALKAAQQRLEWADIVGFMSDAIVGTVAELHTTRAALSALSDRWKVRRRFRAGAASTRALDLLPSYPMITANRFADMLGVSFPSATVAIEQLLDADILRERTGYRRNRVFVAHEALRIINRPFGAEPEM